LLFVSTWNILFTYSISRRLMFSVCVFSQ